MKCLQNIESHRFVKALSEYKEWRDDPLMPFPPVVEPETAGQENFLTEHPYSVLKNGKFNHVPFITGVTKDEGALRTAGFYGDDEIMNEISSNFTKLAPFMLGFFDMKNPAELANKMKTFYLGDKPVSRENIQGLTDMFSDRMMFHPAAETVKIMSSTSSKPVYLYELDYRGKFSFSTLFTKADHDFGVCHGDDIFYLFYSVMAPISDPKYPNENKMINIFLDLWTNFAVSGNPTPTTSDLIPNLWNPAKPGSLKHLKLNLVPTTVNGFHDDRMHFCDTLFPHTKDIKMNTRTDL